MFNESVIHRPETKLIDNYRPIADIDGPVVAEAFYKTLFEHQPVDVSNAAYALHKAVRSLQAQQLSPMRWASFIHIGA
jgi:hypothetical protein